MPSLTASSHTPTGLPLQTRLTPVARAIEGSAYALPRVATHLKPPTRHGGAALASDGGTCPVSPGKLQHTRSTRCRTRRVMETISTNSRGNRHQLRRVDCYPCSRRAPSSPYHCLAPRAVVVAVPVGGSEPLERGRRLPMRVPRIPQNGRSQLCHQIIVRLVTGTDISGRREADLCTSGELSTVGRLGGRMPAAGCREGAPHGIHRREGHLRGMDLRVWPGQGERRGCSWGR